MASLQKPQYIIDPNLGTVRYTFSNVTEWKVPLQLPSAAFAVPGVHGGLDPRGISGNTVAPRTATVTFLHRYGLSSTSTALLASSSIGATSFTLTSALGITAGATLFVGSGGGQEFLTVGSIAGNVVFTTTAATKAHTAGVAVLAQSPEDYGTTYDALVRAMAGDEFIILTREPDGSQRQLHAKLTDLPKDQGIDRMLSGEYTAQFSLSRPTFKSLFPANATVHDYPNVAYDSGFHYDGGLSVALTDDAVNSFIIPNNGNAFDYEPKFTLTGPYSGPIVVQNFSDPIGIGYWNFIYLRDLGAGDVLTVDCATNTVLRNGVVDFGNFAWGQNVPQRDWMRVRTGSNSFNVSHGTGNGVTAIAINTGGTYTSTPAVVISGGSGGYGATAQAVMNTTTGAVQSVLVTAQGGSFGSAPTVSFVGGGGTVAATATATIGANVTGGFISCENFDTWL